ncbi:MAG: helix-turn-helix transcriptional regulator [Clostridia bacterium]|nr:helix-turn-helix transcriptional regulator [Clostridia bacterium]
MQNRIKELRQYLGLNQTEFGARIGIKQTTVAGYENGRTPLDTVVSSICREFGVSRLWLEHGEGPMLSPQADNDIAIITRAMEGQSEAKKRLIRLIAEMPDDLLDAMIAYMEGKR